MLAEVVVHRPRRRLVLVALLVPVILKRCVRVLLVWVVDVAHAVSKYSMASLSEMFLENTTKSTASPCDPQQKQW